MPDRHEQSKNEPSPLCINGGIPSPSFPPSSRKKMLAFLLSFLFIAALLCTSSDKLSIARGVPYPGAHVSIANALASDAPLTRPQVIARAQPSVVWILGAKKNASGSYGSGEIIDQRGYIVTNYHVVDGAQEYHVLLSDNSLLPAQLIGVDPTDDLAVLKITTPKHLSTISLGDSSLLQVGDSVIAIGYPVADLVNVITSIGKIDGSTVTNGMISALEREQPWGSGGMITDAIQTDAELNPGNSGGALVNMQSQLIGITTQILTYEDSTAKVVTPANRPIKGIGFAIPSNRVAFVASQLIQYGYMVHTGHATIGATLVSVTPALATLDSLVIDHGAYISEIEAAGPAALAGLQTGDVIVRVNTTPITNVLDMTDALMPMDAGATVTLGIVRGTQQMQVKVKLQASPTSVQIIGKG